MSLNHKSICSDFGRWVCCWLNYNRDANHGRLDGGKSMFDCSFVHLLCSLSPTHPWMTNRLTTVLEITIMAAARLPVWMLMILPYAFNCRSLWATCTIAMTFAWKTEVWKPSGRAVSRRRSIPQAPAPSSNILNLATVAHVPCALHIQLLMHNIFIDWTWTTKNWLKEERKSVKR